MICVTQKLICIESEYWRCSNFNGWPSIRFVFSCASLKSLCWFPLKITCAVLQIQQMPMWLNKLQTTNWRCSPSLITHTVVWIQVSTPHQPTITRPNNTSPFLLFDSVIASCKSQVVSCNSVLASSRNNYSDTSSTSTLRFYTSGYMSSGSTYFELLRSAEAWVFAEGTVEVVYSELLVQILTCDPMIQWCQNSLDNKCSYSYHFIIIIYLSNVLWRVTSVLA